MTRGWASAARRILTTLAIALLLIEALSAVVCVSWSSGDYWAVLDRGVVRVHLTLPSPRPRLQTSHFFINIPPPPGWSIFQDRPRLRLWAKPYDRFQTGLNQAGHRVAIALWVPLLLAAAPAALLWGRKRMRLGNGRCTNCGYDLQGIATGLCPECGMAAGA
jgi:hypothetical protein